jgi:hypothetical protein
MKAIWMAALVAVVGCGGTDLGGLPGGGNGSTATCTINLTGAISASNVPCIVLLGYDTSNGHGSIAIGNTGTATGLSQLAFGVITAGQPTETTYTIANSVSSSNVAVSSGGTTEWVAVQGASAGSFSLTLTAMSNSTTSGTQTVWTTSHGTATATLQPASNSTASGTVNVSITF